MITILPWKPSFFIVGFLTGHVMFISSICFYEVKLILSSYNWRHVLCVAADNTSQRHDLSTPEQWLTVGDMLFTFAHWVICLPSVHATGFKKYFRLDMNLWCLLLLHMCRKGFLLLNRPWRSYFCRCGCSAVSLENEKSAIWKSYLLISFSCSVGIRGDLQRNVEKS